MPETKLIDTVREIAQEKGWSLQGTLRIVLEVLNPILTKEQTHKLLDTLEDDVGGFLDATDGVERSSTTVAPDRSNCM
jgi:hypothetical protein